MWRIARRPVRVERILPFLIVLATVAAYSNSFRVPLIFDDANYVLYNSAIRSGRIADLPRPRFVVYLTLLANRRLGGNIADYHATNLAIHTLSALLLYGVLRRALVSDALRGRYRQVYSALAGVAACLWAVHPLQTQSVTYVIQRSESLTGLFYLLTLYCLARSASGVRQTLWGACAVAACAAGMGCKEIMVTAPVLALAYDRVFLARSWRELARRRRLVHAGLLASWAVLAWLMVSVHSQPGGSGYGSETAGFGFDRISPAAYAITQFGVVVRYLRLAAWPHPLCLDYAWPVAAGMGEVLPQFLFLCALGIAALWALVRVPPLGFLGLWFFGILAPTSSVMPISDPAVEHRTYLPLAAFMLFEVLAAWELARRVPARNRNGFALRGPIVVCVTSLWIFLFIGMTFRRNHDYRSRKAIWASVLKTCPHNPRARNNYASALANDDKDFEAAIPHFREILRIKPDYVSAYKNLGICLIMTGAIDEGIAWCRKALEAEQGPMCDADAMFDIGIGLARKGDPAGAAQQYRAAIARYPAIVKAYNELGKVLVRMGDVEEAESQFRKAIALYPHFAGAHYELAGLLDRKNLSAEAISHYESAIKANPGHALAHNDLAILLSSRGRNRAAFAHFREARRLSPSYVEARHNLATLLGRVGREEEAVTEYREALALDPDLAATHLGLGLLLRRMGRATEAQRHLRRALELDPGNARACRALEAIQRERPSTEGRSP